jgi:hypothetical protein
VKKRIATIVRSACATREYRTRNRDNMSPKQTNTRHAKYLVGGRSAPVKKIPYVTPYNTASSHGVNARPLLHGYSVGGARRNTNHNKVKRGTLIRSGQRQGQREVDRASCVRVERRTTGRRAAKKTKTKNPPPARYSRNLDSITPIPQPTLQTHPPPSLAPPGPITSPTAS